MFKRLLYGLLYATCSAVRPQPQMGSPRKDRRWFRLHFSLRALFLVSLFVACGISWFVSQTRIAMRQQSAVQQIRELGGHATFEYQLDATRRSVDPPMPPVFVRKLTGSVVMSDVIKVSLHAPHAGDGDMDVLSDLTRLKDLRLNMRQITDDGIFPVETLTHLRRLDLWCTKITDEALPRLAGLRQLRKLDLYSTQVTDEGLRHLRGLTKLEELNLRDTNVTHQGAAMLQEALPNCTILGVEGWPKCPGPTNQAVNRSGEAREM